jgi:hypothetical protein
MRFKKTRAFAISVPKEHKKTKRLIFVIELALILVLLVGTAFTLLGPEFFSPENLWKSIKTRVTLKTPQESKETTNFEDSIRNLVDRKLLGISTIKRSDKGFYTLKSREGVSVIISENKDLESQVRTLQTVLSKAKIEKKKINLVDFRFEKLVVRYSR